MSRPGSILSWNWLLITHKRKKKSGLLEWAAQVLIAVPLLVGIAVSDGVTECDRCAGDAERARCEGARAIDRNLLRTLEISVCQSSCEQRGKAKRFPCFCLYIKDLPEWWLLLFGFWLGRWCNTFQVSTKLTRMAFVHWLIETMDNCKIWRVHSYHWILGASAQSCLWPCSSPWSWARHWALTGFQLKFAKWNWNTSPK